MSDRDPWTVLKIEPSASLEDAQAAHRELLAIYHPDRHSGAPQHIVDRATEMTRELNEAWEAIRSGSATPPPPPRRPSHTAATASADTKDYAPHRSPYPIAEMRGLTRTGGVWFPPLDRLPIPTRSLLSTLGGGLSVPEAPDPHPNRFWVERATPTTLTLLCEVAATLGYRPQHKIGGKHVTFLTSAPSTLRNLIVSLRSDGPQLTRVQVRADARAEHEMHAFFSTARHLLPTLAP